MAAAGLKRRAYDSASHRIRRPSASVLMISMVFPRWLFTTSPGLIAVPEGRFSVAGVRPTTLILGFRRPSTSNAPSTAGPPHLSQLLSPPVAAGLGLVPPPTKRAPLSLRRTAG